MSPSNKTEMVSGVKNKNFWQNLNMVFGCDGGY